MNKKRLLILGAFLFSAIIFAVIFFLTGSKDQVILTPTSSFSESEQLISEPMETRKITLFYLSDRDSLLHPEEREIVAGSSVAHQARQTIEELLKGSLNGSISPFPPETKLRELFLTREGVAYVDFSRELEERHLAGSEAEIATIFSIVNSLTYNFKSIKKVFILVDGDERETLRGHIDLSQPFLPQYRLIAN